MQAAAGKVDMQAVQVLGLLDRNKAMVAVVASIAATLAATGQMEW